MSSTNSFKASAVQMRSGTDPAGNIKDLEDLVGQAAGLGADYVQTPEMTGALVRDRAQLLAILSDERHDPVVAAASELAQRHELFLHIGSTAVQSENGKVANRAFLFAPDGDIVARYDKLHMFDVDLDNGESWRESATYQAGSEGFVAQTPLASIGLAICYDVRFPSLFRQQALLGADVLTAPAAFTRQTGKAHWHVMQRARAIENGAFMISAAQGGVHEDGRETFGHSIIVDPWGTVLAEAAHDEPGVIAADIDREASCQARAKIPNLKNEKAFSVTSVTARELLEAQI